MNEAVNEGRVWRRQNDSLGIIFLKLSNGINFE